MIQHYQLRTIYCNCSNNCALPVMVTEWSSSRAYSYPYT